MMMHSDEVAKLLLDLDRIEAEMRSHERALYSIRHRLAKRAGLRAGEFGFTEDAPESPR